MLATPSPVPALDLLLADILPRLIYEEVDGGAHSKVFCIPDAMADRYGIQPHLFLGWDNTMITLGVVRGDDDHPTYYWPATEAEEASLIQKVETHSALVVVRMLKSGLGGAA